ncbi:hypothetical protein [Sulfuracidifex tepidarius]|uniref:Uncharacterized protein n=1 Tax=Sulfuracidifex tepidarius TaxID=1294262 RepID=A0A510E5Q5_9CREN|nr:hypothetical protein [Sulfuracidifex tepidarius]BBG27767.1 hypothetical protein IC007_2321 [Sulfuracidifex tepidarius]
MVSKHIGSNIDYVVMDEEEKGKVKDKKLFWKRGFGFIDFIELI